jgi:hypothetical protein
MGCAGQPVDTTVHIQDEVRREVEHHDAVIGIGPVPLTRRCSEHTPVVVPEQEDVESKMAVRMSRTHRRRASLTSCRMWIPVSASTEVGRRINT